MEVNTRGPGPAAPFLSARDRFTTEYSLTLPVQVHIQEDPDARTWTTHHEDHHKLNISRAAAQSAMASELALHEYSHMLRHEQEHPSHIQSTREAIYLALAGESVEQQHLTHCYQISNHMKDIYADDITLRVGPSTKLLRFLESQLAAAVTDRSNLGLQHGTRITAQTHPAMTAINSAFALALLERHDALPSSHRIYDLAHAAATDAQAVHFDWYKNQFKSLPTDPTDREYKQILVDLTREYATTQNTAAD